MIAIKSRPETDVLQFREDTAIIAIVDKLAQDSGTSRSDVLRQILRQALAVSGLLERRSKPRE